MVTATLECCWSPEASVDGSDENCSCVYSYSLYMFGVIEGEVLASARGASPYWEPQMSTKQHNPHSGYLRLHQSLPAGTFDLTVTHGIDESSAVFSDPSEACSTMNLSVLLSPMDLGSIASVPEVDLFDDFVSIYLVA